MIKININTFEKKLNLLARFEASPVFLDDYRQIIDIMFLIGGIFLASFDDFFITLVNFLKLSLNIILYEI